MNIPTTNNSATVPAYGKSEETSRELRNVGGSDLGRFWGFPNAVEGTAVL